MSQLLELPDDLFAALKKAADASGTTPQGWIASRLPNSADETPSASSRTMADLFAGRIGRIRSGGKEKLSENCGGKLAEHLERKHAEGHL